MGFFIGILCILDNRWIFSVYSSSGNNNSYTPFAPLAPLHGVEAQEQQPHQQNYVPASNDYDHNYPVQVIFSWNFLKLLWLCFQTSLYDSPYYPNADDRHMSFSGSHTYDFLKISCPEMNIFSDTSSVCSNTSDRSPGFSDMENRSPAANSRFVLSIIISVLIALVQILRQTRSGWPRLARTLIWLCPSSHLTPLGLVFLLLDLSSYSPAVAAKTPRQTKQGRAARCRTQSACHCRADRVHEFGWIAEGSQEWRTYWGTEGARQKDQKKR